MHHDWAGIAGKATNIRRIRPGGDYPGQPGVSCTIRPPTIVINDVQIGERLSSTVSGSALSTARSANLPGSSEPLFVFVERQIGAVGGGAAQRLACA